MRPQLNCPHCGSTDHRVVLLDPRNWFLIIAEASVLLLDVLSSWMDEFNGFPLYRRCRGCGRRFFAARKFARNLDECPECGYNLTGNVSGRCSECGWKLTRRYRAHRKKVEAGR